MYVLNLRGNQRTSGEQSRKEGGKVFGQGSRATVAITLLVKESGAIPVGGASIKYHDIGDYLSREQKLERVADASVESLSWLTVAPNAQADWLGQRSSKYDTLMPITDGENGLFGLHSRGLQTGRDAWVTNSSQPLLESNVSGMIDFYNGQVEAFEKAVMENSLGKERLAKAKSFVNRDPEKYSWNPSDFDRVSAGRRYGCSNEMYRVAHYRPFFMQHVAMDGQVNHSAYRLPAFYPKSDSKNIGICLVASGSRQPFSVLASRAVPFIHLIGSDTTLFVARWRYAADSEDDLLSESSRISNIQPQALTRFREIVGDDICDDDLFAYAYGVLHSPAFREEFAVNLKKEAPRVPLPTDRDVFDGVASVGQTLLNLHLDYERAEPYALDEVWAEGMSTDERDRFRVEKLEYPKVRVDGKLVADRTRLVCNPWLTLDGIPERAHEYVIGTRSAVDWLVDRYKVKIDKTSGIRNDPNDWAEELGDPRYIVDLVKRIVTVSLGTLDAVESLPALAFDSE